MKKVRFALLTAALLGTIAAGTVTSGQDAPADIEAVFQRLDKNGDGKISADEIPEEQSRFFARLLRRANKEPNGELTREEFRKASQPEERPNVPLDNAGPEQARADARQRFDMLDRNKDGKVTLDEVPEPLRDRLKPVFDRAGKQELTFEDLARFNGPGNRPDPAELFKQFDANSDGKLSKDEIPAAMRERLNPLFDRLGKQELTLEDFQAVRERMREAGGARPDGSQSRSAEEMFSRLDANSDGKLTADEAPERIRPLVLTVLQRAGKERDGSLTKDEFVKNFPGAEGRGTDAPRRADGERRPEGDRPIPERRAEAPAADRMPAGERRPAAPPGEGRGPALFRLADTNHDGHVSKEEFAKLAELFEQLDRNHDGQLDPQELMGMPPAPPEGMRRGDGRNGDAGRSGDAGRGRDAGRDAEAGRNGDAGRGGEPAGRDASAPRQEGGRAPGAFFQRLDRDGDGKISRDEAPPFLKERFAMLDTNGDGFITQDELRAGAKILGDMPRARIPESSRPE